MKDPRRVDGTPTRAHFPGHCDACEQPYPAGTLIVRTRRGWTHQYCNDERGVR